MVDHDIRNDILGDGSVPGVGLAVHHDDGLFLPPQLGGNFLKRDVQDFDQGPILCASDEAGVGDLSGLGLRFFSEDKLFPMRKLWHPDPDCCGAG